MSKNPMRLVLSPLTKLIYATRVRPIKGSPQAVEPTGVKHDVTSDALGVIIQHIGVGNTITVNANGKPAYTITVKEVESP